MKARILLLEDDPAHHSKLERMLKQAGYAVISFYDMSSALEYIQTLVQNKDAIFPDLALLDVNMGQNEPYGGAIVAQELTKIRQIPIIYVSSYTKENVLPYKLPFPPVFLDKKLVWENDQVLLDNIEISLQNSILNFEKFRVENPDLVPSFKGQVKNKLNFFGGGDRIFDLKDVVYIISSQGAETIDVYFKTQKAKKLLIPGTADMLRTFQDTVFADGGALSDFVVKPQHIIAEGTAGMRILQVEERQRNSKHNFGISFTDFSNRYAEMVEEGVLDDLLVFGRSDARRCAINYKHVSAFGVAEQYVKFKWDHPRYNRINVNPAIIQALQKLFPRI